MTEQTALGTAIEEHWREHRPRMVKDLEKQKRLKQAVLEAQELTGNLLYELVSVKKMDYGAAWEVAMTEWTLPEDPPPPPRGYGATRAKKHSSRKSSRSRKRRYRKTSG